MPLTVTLGGVELLADQPATWVSRPGVQPQWQDFEVTPGGISDLLERRGPLDLVVTRESGKIETWHHLWALHEVAGDDPFCRRVRVFDRRWFWSRKHVGPRHFNKRRRIGFYRIRANDSLELERVEENVAYAKHSLDPTTGKPWLPLAIPRLVADDLAKFEAANGGALFPFRFESSEPGTVVENLELDHAGDVAMGLALAAVPGMLVRVDPSGEVVFYSQLDGSEKAVREQNGPEIVGGGHVVVVSHRNDAPAAIDVLFQIESELRFDYIERGAEETVEYDPDEDLRELRAVIPVPDYQIEIDGELVTQGTFVEQRKWVASLPTLPGGGVLTDDMIRTALMPYSGLWKAIESVAPLAFGNPAAGAREQLDWTARIAAINQWYLRCMRLPRGWNDRVLAWSPTRVATVNQADGSRAPAMIFGDFAYVGGERSWIRSFSEADKIEYLTSIDFYRDELDNEARPSPCEVRLLHADQGIVALDYLLDPNRTYEQILPAKADGNISGAGYAPGHGFLGLFPDWNYTFDSISDPSTVPPKLTDQHRLALILTAIPACTPNHSDPSDVLYRVRVNPGDVATLPGGERLVGQFGAFRGPVMEVRVNASLETARLRWIDAKREEFEKLFGVRPGKADLAGLCVNKDEASAHGIAPGIGGATLGAPLDQIARAIAFSIWSSYIDHPQGQSTGDLSFGVVPRGWTDAIVHAVRPNGESTTVAMFPERLPQIDWMPRLSPSAQAIIRRLAHTARG